MSPAGTAPTEFHEGVNDPSPITHVIALDWYDGPTEGVLQVGDAGPVYKFALLDERQRADDTDVRAYGLYPLPADALARLTDAISPYLSPRWPVWWPVWQFPTDEIRRAVDAKTEDIISRAGPLSWVVVGNLGHGPVRALPVKTARAS